MIIYINNLHYCSAGIWQEHVPTVCPGNNVSLALIWILQPASL